MTEINIDSIKENLIAERDNLFAKLHGNDLRLTTPKHRSGDLACKTIQRMFYWQFRK